MNTPVSDDLRYAGFWPRLAALLLDFLILLPLTVAAVWANESYRLFELYYILPSILLGFFYSVYLVRRYGGTPGKLIAGIRIRKLSGDPVGYREAFLRYFPEFVIGLLMAVALILTVIHMTDAEDQSLSFLERARRMMEVAPSWYKPLQIVQNVWVWGELIVLLTNRKRRAIHDFIAGTVVVHASSNKPVQTRATASVGP